MLAAEKICGKETDQFQTFTVGELKGMLNFGHAESLWINGCREVGEREFACYKRVSFSKGYIDDPRVGARPGL